MFRNSIQRSPFYGEVADECFPNIRGDAWRNDCSFISTMRALLAPRMNDEDAIFLGFSSRACAGSDLTGDPMHDIAYIMGDADIASYQNRFVIHSLNGDTDGNVACMECVRSCFTEAFPEYQQIPKITAFFQRSFDVLGYCNAERRVTILFVGSPMDMRKMHYLQMCMLPALPWFFDKSKGVSADEMSLINSLREQSPDKYITCLNKLAAAYDFRSIEIKQKLEGFERRRIDSEIECIRSEISGIDSDIDSWMSSINDALSCRDDRCVRLLGLETRQASADDSELMEYFVCNKRLHLESVEGSTIRFVVCDYLSYFDQDMAESIIDCTGSFVYAYGGADLTEEQMAKLLRAVFVDETLKMKVCAAYSVSIGGGVRALAGYDYPPACDDCMPNPHIDEFSCLGNYARTLAEMARAANYIGAIEQCVASCKSLNWGDSTVAGRMVRNLHDRYRSTKFIELPGGTMATPKDAVAWLEAHECE